MIAVHRVRVASPNDSKLSDCGGLAGDVPAGGKAAAEGSTAHDSPEQFAGAHGSALRTVGERCDVEWPEAMSLPDDARKELKEARNWRYDGSITAVGKDVVDEALTKGFAVVPVEILAILMSNAPEGSMPWPKLSPTAGVAIGKVYANWIRRLTAQLDPTAEIPIVG